MSGVKLQTLGGQKLVVLDFRDVGPAEGIAILKEARPLISGQPPGSLLTLTLAAGARFDSEATAALKEFTKVNRPFVKRAAVVGTTGMIQFLVSMVRLFTGRDIRSFDDEEAARGWLLRGD